MSLPQHGYAMLYFLKETFFMQIIGAMYIQIFFSSIANRSAAGGRRKARKGLWLYKKGAKRVARLTKTDFATFFVATRLRTCSRTPTLFMGRFLDV
ncbi:MAG: hypothetical protein Q4F57_04900 [Weeksellaceae bacterium]|nr:hypothetical protein [Weeksellaceae bacterium]